MTEPAETSGPLGRRQVEPGEDPYGNATADSTVPGAPMGWDEDPGPELPRGVPEPGDLPALTDLYEPSEVSDTEIYAADLEARGAAADPGQFEDPLLGLDLREDETTDPMIAMEEGIPYVPPSDPVIAGNEADGDPIVASGFSASAIDEPYDASHHSSYELDENEMIERVRDALRADAQTSAYAESLEIAVLNGQATLAGRVEDLEDADAILAVAERATGIGEVVDRLDVASVDAVSEDQRAED